MTIGKTIFAFTFAAAVGFSGAVQAGSFGGMHFPTLTFSEKTETVTSKSNAKTKACKIFCKKSVKK